MTRPKILLAKRWGSSHAVPVRCQNEKLVIGQVEHLLSRPFSSAKPRGSHRSYQRFFTTERPFSLAHRIGSVIREQRPARATTRTTGCSLIAGFLHSWPKTLGMGKVTNVEIQLAGRCWNGSNAVATESRILRSENIRWSSSPVPVNRLQATGEPKYRASGRRVMTGGSISDCLAPKNRTDPNLWATTGKALAFTKEQSSTGTVHQ